MVNLESIGRRMQERITQDVQVSSVDALGDVINGAFPTEFGDGVATYIVDLEQSNLILLPVRDSTVPKLLQLEETAAGIAFQRLQTVVVNLDNAESAGAFQTMTWLPLVSGSERVGVLGIRSSVSRSGNPIIAGWLARLAQQVSDLLLESQPYSDYLIQLRRTRDVDIAAQMQWGLLPPLNYDDPVVSLAAALEPALSVAGDGIDYAVDGSRVRFAVLDAVGHGLQSARVVSLAVSAYRNALRRGLDLAATVDDLEDALTIEVLDHQFVTGLVGEFSPETGLLVFISAGHPPPIVLRSGGVVDELGAPNRLPFGLSHLSDSRDSQPTVARLIKGDHILMFTDGVTDARSPEGELFGLKRLLDLVLGHLEERMSPAESLRRITASLRSHHQARLADDATLMLLHWHPQT